MADLKAMAENLVNLTVKEVNELAEILKEEYGIEPAAAAVAVAGPAGGGEAGGGEERARADEGGVQGDADARRVGDARRGRRRGRRADRGHATQVSEPGGGATSSRRDGCRLRRV